MDIREEGKKNEEVVAEDYRRRGYQVINVNEKGFPDLIVLKDKQITRFIEVRSWTAPCPLYKKKYHDKLKKEGFETEIIYVKDRKIADK